MRANVWMSGLMASGLLACGHIPGYYPEDEAPPRGQPSAEPKGPPAPPQTARRGEDTTTPEDDTEPYDDETEAEDEAPPYEPPPKPPRYTPPPTWEPAPTQRTPAPTPTRTPSPAPQPTRVAEAPADGVKTIRLDADTYYLVDERRNLCFLRHKESMTAIDCSRVTDTSTRTEPPAPARPEPPARTTPTRPVEPARGPASPTPDETARFEAAFTDIFCDRKYRDETPPDERIRARGLSVERYESIETWWAGDENAWFALTSKAARTCQR